MRDTVLAGIGTQKPTFEPPSVLRQKRGQRCPTHTHTHRVGVTCARLARACLQVTTPTAAMKAAMLNAELGDDVFGDDPTVIELEKMCAATFGKPAGLFVPSGTMGNLIAVMTHCNERASELIIGDKVPRH